MRPKVNLPPVFEPIFEPHRVKTLIGGRGSGKSETIGRKLLADGIREPLNIVCGREFQNSIKESVHSMLSYLIEDMGIQSEYEVLNSEIKGANGTQFSFVGLSRNIDSIRSMHNIKRFWGEEAHKFSQRSLDILFPTIRGENSELYFTMNPELEEDPAYQYLVVNPPPDSIVIKANYMDNPFFPEVLRAEMEDMKENDYQKYLHIWEGQPLSAVVGAIFEKEMQKVQSEGRILHVPYDPTKPVDIFYDLGRGDKTAMWFFQQIGFEYHLIRYYENNREHFSHYVKYAKEQPYAYGKHYLPHDAENENIAAEKTIKTQAIDAFGRNSVVIVRRIPKKALAIDAARGVFGRCYFDKELCADGLTCLRKYAYKVDEESGRVSREPEHDTPWSHGADAFMGIGQSLLPTQRPKDPQPKRQLPRHMSGKVI